MARAKKATTDKYQLVADQLLVLLESGTKPWSRGWTKTPYCNAATGHYYRGLNPVLAEISVMSKGYKTTLFLGFKQAKAMGLKLVKGSKATWLRLGGVGKTEEIDPKTEEKQEKFYRFGKWINVYNLDCFTDEAAPMTIAELVARYQVEQNTGPRLPAVEALIEAQQATIVVGGNRACYAPGQDQIHMPPYEHFSSAAAYYATLIHELSHRTGHESRLNRDLSGDQGTAAYAFEELIADMAAAFVCSLLDISPDLENHASYLDGWMRLIEDDNQAFFRAYGQAKEAADLLLETAGISTPAEASASA